jgi:hypothetical protein
LNVDEGAVVRGPWSEKCYVRADENRRPHRPGRPVIFPDTGPLLRLFRRPLTRRGRKIDLVIWLAAAGFVFAVLIPHRRHSFPHDFHQFWVTGQALKTMNVSNIYSDRVQRTVTLEFKQRASAFRSERLRRRAMGANKLNYTGTPMLMAFLNVVCSGDFDEDVQRFRIASILLYSGGILLLAAALGFSGAAALLFLVAFTTFFWPFQMNMIVANVSGAQAGAFMMILALLRGASPQRQGLIGFLLGMLNLLKPTVPPAVLLLLVGFAADRRWREAAWFSAGLVVAAVLGIAIPWMAFGPACTWLNWRAAMPAACFTPWGLTGGFLAKLLGVTNPAVYGFFSLALIVAAAALVLRTGHRIRLKDHQRWLRDAGAAALGALIVLLSSPIVRSHYFVAAVAAALISLRPGGVPGGAGAFRTTLRLLAVFLLAAHPTLRRLGLTNWPHHSLWTFTGVWILAGLLVWERLAASGGAAGLFRRYQESP